MEKKYKIDFANNSAIERRTLPSGRITNKMFMLFIDCKGVHILDRAGAVYMTPENCEVL